MTDLNAQRRMPLRGRVGRKNDDLRGTMEPYGFGPMQGEGMLEQRERIPQGPMARINREGQAAAGALGVSRYPPPPEMPPEQDPDLAERLRQWALQVGIDPRLVDQSFYRNAPWDKPIQQQAEDAMQMLAPTPRFERMEPLQRQRPPAPLAPAIDSPEGLGRWMRHHVDRAVDGMTPERPPARARGALSSAQESMPGGPSADISHPSELSMQDPMGLRDVMMDQSAPRGALQASGWQGSRGQAGLELSPFMSPDGNMIPIEQASDADIAAWLQARRRGAPMGRR